MPAREWKAITAVAILGRRYSYLHVDGVHSVKIASYRVATTPEMMEIIEILSGRCREASQICQQFILYPPLLLLPFPFVLSP